MIVLIIFFLIIILSFAFIKNNLNPTLIRRLCALSLISSGFLILNTLNFQIIGSGIGLFCGFFHVNFITHIISFFILLVSAIILLIWPN